MSCVFEITTPTVAGSASARLAGWNDIIYGIKLSNWATVDSADRWPAGAGLAKAIRQPCLTLRDASPAGIQVGQWRIGLLIGELKQTCSSAELCAKLLNEFRFEHG